MNQQPRLLVFCTLSTGLDAIAEVLRQGYKVSTIVGVNPLRGDSIKISGFIDIKSFAAKWSIPYIYMSRYDMKSEADRQLIESLEFDLVWVAGWQRLIPGWVLARAPLGTLGSHGSPDGIHGGRGRSPQNWAIMFGCQRFDLALFRITEGIDNGPVIAERSFFYNETDDIGISYKKVSLCLASMVLEVLKNPSLLEAGYDQPENAFYYPQRSPEDGFADWNLTQLEIWAHCRALTTPYPGLRTKSDGGEIIIWKCLPFDDTIRGAAGQVDMVFEDSCFLVSCGDGRVLVQEYEIVGESFPITNGMQLISLEFSGILSAIVAKHQAKYPQMPVTQRILRRLPK
jgi:UDP-4-amino-4-deoxy-L-arabinose formyltransferase/UDP-glucuronic acid dehydrogenase (UDP-4-keto-hexauronic acid decarboxylating)